MAALSAHWTALTMDDVMVWMSAEMTASYSVEMMVAWLVHYSGEIAAERWVYSTAYRKDDSTAVMWGEPQDLSLDTR